MPVFDLSKLFAFYEATRAQSSFLFSVILAISARFCYRKTAPQTAGAPPLMLEVDAQTFDELADAAESHLARTLLRKQHAVTDVQGTLLMATWGLRSGGGGPDAWVRFAMTLPWRLLTCVDSDWARIPNVPSFGHAPR